MKTKEIDAHLSDHAKVSIIFNERNVHREWIKGDLSPDEKRKVLEGMDIAIDGRWILELIKDLRDLRRT